MGILSRARACARARARITQVQFIGSLLRLSAALYAPHEALSLGAKLTRLCTEHVAPHVHDELQLVTDGFSLMMKSRMLGAVLDRHQPWLAAVFREYAASDTTGDGSSAGYAAAKATLSTINMRECHAMAEDTKLFDASFTPMALIAIFVKVAAPATGSCACEHATRTRARAVRECCVALARAAR